MCDLTETERQYLTETQSLTRHAAGREVLVGLTDQVASGQAAIRTRTVGAEGPAP
jgi:hypothetical protein